LGVTCTGGGRIQKEINNKKGFLMQMYKREYINVVVEGCEKIKNNKRIQM
jgi:hypothetical protein